MKMTAVFLFVTLVGARTVEAQLDETWTVSVNGQTVRVDPDGRFVISNVAAPDLFGPGGPGTIPDAVSDDVLLLIGSSTAGGVTRYVISEPFQISRGESYDFNNFIITDTPPPLPASTRVVADPNLLSVGETTQLVVTGILLDGSEVDVTQRASGTIYRTSSPTIVTVGENGLVTAHAPATAFVTSVTTGVTSVERIDVIAETANTTIEGFVQNRIGAAVAGAEAINVQTFESLGLTDAKGFFSMPVELDVGSTASVRISSIDNTGQSLTGQSAVYPMVANGITDVGIIVAESSFGGFLFPAPGIGAGVRARETATGDLNGDGQQDVVVGGFSEIAVMLGRGDGTFDAGDRYSTPGCSQSLLLVDLDHDTDLDLVTKELCVGSLTIRINNGLGGFSDPVSFDAGSCPFTLGAGDVDNDGDVDVVAIDVCDFSLTVLRGNGNGTFGDFESIAVFPDAPPLPNAAGISDTLSDVAIADFDGDGASEIAVAYYQTIEETRAAAGFDEIGGHIALFTAQNDTFVETLTVDVGRLLKDMDVADFNGDGAPDIAVAESYGAAAYVLINNSVEGAASFLEADHYFVLQQVQALDAVDLDNDGDVDLALAGSGIDTLFNNGDGMFTSKTNYPVGEQLRDLDAADVTGDGYPELLITDAGNSGIVGMMINEGDGHYEANTTYFGGECPIDIAAGDPDADGDLDLVVADDCEDAVVVLSNDGRGRFGPDTYAISDDVERVTLGDVNNDGFPDVAATLQGTQLVAVFLNDGQGGLLPGATYGVGNYPQSIAMEDFDGDTNLDLAVVNDQFNDESVSILFGLGDGTFEDEVRYPTAQGNGAYDIASGDFNGDTSPDLVVVDAATTIVTILPNNGDGSFALPQTASGGIVHQGIAVGDFDRDGSLDVATAGSTRLAVFLNNGDGSLGLPTLFSSGVDVVELAVGHLNDDEFLDAVTVNETPGGTASLFLGNGDGTFAGRVVYPVGPYPTAVAIEDIDGDGDNDLAVADDDDNFSILYNDGDGTMTNGPVYLMVDDADDLDFADMNGDGSPDLVPGIDDPAIFVFFNDGAGRLSGSSKVPTGDEPAAVTLEDLNGDGAPDLAATMLGSGQVAVAFNMGVSGEISFATPLYYAAGVEPIAIGTGDFDGNGLVDLVVANETTSGTVSVLLAEGDPNAPTYGEPTTLAVHQNPLDLTVADFNGDTLPDIATVSDNSNDIAVLVNVGGGGFADAVFYGGQDDHQAVAAGDVNGDGTPDLVVTGDGNACDETAAAGGNCFAVGMFVYLNDGDGTFVLGAFYPSDASGSEDVESVVIHDLNNDGSPDVAFTVEDTGVTVFLNNGDGTFSNRVTYWTGGEPTSVVAGDLDNDGDADLAVTDDDTERVIVLFNQLLP